MLVQQHIQHLETTAHTGPEAAEALPGRALRAGAVEEGIEGESQPIGGVVSCVVVVVVVGGQAGGVVEVLVVVVVVVTVVVIHKTIVRMVIRIGEVRRRHNRDTIVIQIDRIPRNARERVLRRVVREQVAEVIWLLLLRGSRIPARVAEVDVSTAVRGFAVVRRFLGRVGALGVGGVLHAESDESGADAGGEVFD